ncbi:MAG: hypothetical protein L6R41_001086 [Letrouitia leprolyta]|nr:MAG: hypothetical protein L6R41_001086 [Letrouitia leprolyta]
MEAATEDLDIQDVDQETPAENVFIAPSFHEAKILAGASYTHHSPIPNLIEKDLSVECVLGVDEAGRGPVLGPMVYGLLYLPLELHRSLLAETHHFDDSKVLKPNVRSDLMEALCTAGTDLYESCGWATRVMSARDISSGMLKPFGPYNLNAQAMDATIELIKEVFAKGVNVTDIFIDTIGKEQVYQKKLERIFPTTKITVAKKADSKFPCVSAASVCAKVTRDAALEVGYQAYYPEAAQVEGPKTSADAWGSGYPSDARSITWLTQHKDPLFGWGNEARFSWRTIRDMLDANESGIKVDWPDVNNDQQARQMTEFYITTSAMEEEGEQEDELALWYGKPVAESVL